MRYTILLFFDIPQVTLLRDTLLYHATETYVYHMACYLLYSGLQPWLRRRQSRLSTGKLVTGHFISYVSDRQRLKLRQTIAEHIDGDHQHIYRLESFASGWNAIHGG